MTTANPISLPNYAGVDFNQILQSVLAFGKIPIAQVQQQVAGETVAISVLGRIGGDLSSLQTVLSQFQTIGSNAPLSAGTAAGASFTASVSGTPLAGVYNVSVNQLAAGQVSASQGYASNTNSVGTGTITVTTGGVAHNITIDSSNQTLDGVAGAINAAAIGVTAQVVNTGLPADPYRLEDREQLDRHRERVHRQHQLERRHRSRFHEQRRRSGIARFDGRHVDSDHRRNLHRHAQSGLSLHGRFGRDRGNRRHHDRLYVGFRSERDD